MIRRLSSPFSRAARPLPQGAFGARPLPYRRLAFVRPPTRGIMRHALF